MLTKRQNFSSVEIDAGYLSDNMGHIVNVLHWETGEMGLETQLSG